MRGADAGAIAVSLALGVHCVQALLHHPPQVLRIGRVMTVRVGRGDANSEAAKVAMLRAALVIPATRQERMAASATAECWLIINHRFAKLPPSSLEEV
jgi:hypothetical protein